MPRELICPGCGLLLPLEPASGSVEATLPEAACTVETILPKTDDGEGGSSSPLGPVPAAAVPPAQESLFYWAAPEELGGSGPEPEREAPRETSPMPAAAPVPAPVPWGRVLLASYASAMTLACLWLWWQSHRAPARPADPDLGQRTATRRGDRSRVVDPPVAVPAEQTTTLGRPLRSGTLEFTPLAIARGSVVLESMGLDGRERRRDGGSDALMLRVRCRNLSANAIFAPLDESFLREPDSGLPQSFIEAADGARIYPYPLPVASEWSIVGQSFSELKPGESHETIIVSDANAVSRLRRGMLWRIRLRDGTAPQATALVGVRFEPDQVEGLSRLSEAR